MCLDFHWLQMSLRSYAFFSWEASCYESCFQSHDISIYCMMELWTSLHICILDIIIFELVFWLLLHGWKVLYQWCCCIHHIILHFEMSSLVLWNKSHSSLLVGDYVCGLSYKSNAFVWLEKFHKEYSYWQILMHKYVIIFSQYNIHPYLTETFYMPSISTRTTMRLCTTPICQQRGFILDK